LRVFIGVELDDRVKAAAAAVAERLRQRLRRTAPDLEARWIASDNLHITIWFIGEVDDQRAAAIADALQLPFETRSFDLALAKCGVFPPSGPPRVFWIGIHEGSRGMLSLYGEMGRRLAPFGFVEERRPYTAHLTIARVKHAGRGTSRLIRESLAKLPADCGACRVSAVTLFRSRLSPRGAAYEPLLRVPLA
jgi:RNA 2',3'-cyclic 3'-phosphodiesterase